MKANALVQVLGSVYHQDLAKFTELKTRLAALEGKRAELLLPPKRDPGALNSLEFSTAASKYLSWRQSEARKISRMIFELKPEVITAKKIVTKSFGRLEAMKELIARGKI
ncbi:hypothetical protein BCF46_2974 [Litoreibacter meonggei]|uniref:Uncharacterized protein n=1 Tax=Litoreibacter meonggei TaxID=1049199 RepID=A0A497VQ82_9RHOB|nr:hypothetical protein [Litoreibacter meonggei]RLJ41186.1 hypothetical protein BCF46_2974 [Litoreibacter meonggei]